jgi:hypothetical protein
MAVLTSSDLFALIPFIFAVCITETVGHTKSNITCTVQKQRENNFKYSVGKIVVHKGKLLYSGQWIRYLSHPYKQ